MDHAVIQETLKLDQMTLLCKQRIVTYPMLEAACWKTYQDIKKQMESLVCCVLSHFSRVQLFVTPWTVAHQVPLSMELSRQEYWNGLPCPPPGDLPHLGI